MLLSLVYTMSWMTENHKFIKIQDTNTAWEMQNHIFLTLNLLLYIRAHNTALVFRGGQIALNINSIDTRFVSDRYKHDEINISVDVSLLYLQPILEFTHRVMHCARRCSPCPIMCT